MNDLFDKQRYDDVLRVYDRFSKTNSSDFVNFDAFRVAVEANLLRVNYLIFSFNLKNHVFTKFIKYKNNAESNKRLNDFVQIIKKKKLNNYKTLACLFLNIIENSNKVLAKEFIEHIDSLKLKSDIITNIKVKKN
jgi:hypothetical protein